MVSTTGTRIRIRTGLTTWGAEEMLGVSIQEVDTAHQREEDESNKEPPSPACVQAGSPRSPVGTEEKERLSVAAAPPQLAPPALSVGVGRVLSAY